MRASELQLVTRRSEPFVPFRVAPLSRFPHHLFLSRSLFVSSLPLFLAHCSTPISVPFSDSFPLVFFPRSLPSLSLPISISAPFWSSLFSFVFVSFYPRFTSSFSLWKAPRESLSYAFLYFSLSLPPTFLVSPFLLLRSPCWVPIRNPTNRTPTLRELQRWKRYSCKLCTYRYIYFCEKSLPFFSLLKY